MILVFNNLATRTVSVLGGLLALLYVCTFRDSCQLLWQESGGNCPLALQGFPQKGFISVHIPLTEQVVWLHITSK